MIIRHRILAATLVACFVIAFTTPLLAQSMPTWGKIQQFPVANGYISDIYAFNPQVVLIGWHWNITTSDVGMVMRTTDGGATWSNCTIGPGISTNTTPVVTDIWFRTPDSGWMTISGKLNPGDDWLWRTVDSGKTWTGVNFGFGGGTSGLASVWQTDSTLVVTQNQGAGVWYSQDVGLTWHNPQATLHNNALSFDHMLGVATECSPPQTTTFLTTTNGGVTWVNSIGGFQHEAWGLHYISNGTYVVAPEDVPIAGVSQKSYIARSTSYGVYWSKILQLPINTTGDIEGVQGVLYIQSSGGIAGTNPIYNVMESTDGGLTWFGAGGIPGSQAPSQGAPDPYRNCDTRFAVTGCGNILYISDNSAGLWKTLDAPGLTFIDSNALRPIAATICDTTKQLYYLHNINTSGIIVNDIRILDSNRRPAKTGAVWLDSLPDPYEPIAQGDSIAFKLAWHPGAMMDSTGADSAVIRVIYNASYLGACSEMKLAYDTILMPVTLRGFSVPADYALSSQAIKTDSLPICETVDTTITLVNFGCDTLVITRAQLAKNAWSLTDTLGNSLRLPLRIAGGDSLRLRMRATPTSAALLYDSLEVRMHYEGHDTLWGASLRTSAKMGIGPLSAPGALTFDSLATCDSSDEFITLSNLGCDTLRITTLSGANATFEVLDTNGAPLPKPLAIPQDSTRHLLIRFIPGTLGSKSALLKLAYQYFGFDSSTVISLSGIGAASGTLSYTASMNFGEVSICQSQIDTLAFRNTSCDSASVQSLTLSGPFVLLDSAKVPSGISSGKTLYLRVRYQPRLKKPESGTASLVGWANNGQTIIADTIPLSGIGVAGTSTFVTTPALTDSTLAFATRTQCDHADSISFTIQNTGCDTMTITGLTLDPSLTTVFTAHANLPLPAIIPDGASLRVTVAIVNLLAGSYSGNLHILYTSADGVAHDSIVSTRETITPGSGGQAALSLRSPTPISFNQIQACSTSTDTSILVTYDAGCGTIVLYDSISGTGFRIAGADSILLSPGDTAKIPVYYDGASRGNLSSTVHLTSAVWASPVDVAVSGTVAPVDSVHFHLTFSSMPVAAGQIFTAALVPDIAISGRGLHAIHGSFVWRRDNFQVGPSTMTTAPGFALNQSGPIDAGTITRYNFDVTSGSDIALDPSSAIVTLPMMAMISDTPGGLIAIDSLLLNQSDPTYSDCELASDGLATGTQLSNRCGDSTLIHYLEGQPIVLAERPRPDPVTSENGYRTTLNLTSAIDGTVEITLYDDLSREVSRSKPIPLTHGVAQPYTLNLRALPAGSYHYEALFTGSGSSGNAKGSLLLVK